MATCDAFQIALAGGHSRSQVSQWFCKDTLQRRLAMTECNITTSTLVLGAIDISKERHEVLIEVPDKKAAT